VESAPQKTKTLLAYLLKRRLLAFEQQSVGFTTHDDFQLSNF
jgi:hypothetical protein